MTHLAPDEEADQPAESRMTVELHREYWGAAAAKARGRCVILCQQPRAVWRRLRCPDCGRKAVGLTPDDCDAEPWPTRAERFAAWTGGWITAFMDALVFPFRRPDVPGECAECARRELIQTASEADREQ